MMCLTRRVLPLLLAALAPLAPASAGDLGFESCEPGPFQALETSLGVWLVRSGDVRVDATHARSGERSLHLLGGLGDHASSVELMLSEDLQQDAQFGFWAERWTKREPFRFLVQARGSGPWRDVYDGADTRVGGFQTQVRFELKAGDRVLRFACQAPLGTGVLIDDLTLEPFKPMELVSVSVTQPRLPVLIGNSVNPVLHIQLKTEGGLQPLELREVKFDLSGTTHPEHVERVQLLVGDESAVGAPGPQAELPEFERVPMTWALSEESIHLRSKLSLRPGTNDLWVSVTLKAEADMDGFVDAHAIGFRLSGQEHMQPLAESPADAAYRQRIGVALRRAGDDEVAVHRIPGLATTPKGTLIAVYDLRWDGWGDLPGNIDVGLSRSTDGGRHWQPMQVVMDMGQDPEWRHDGVGDPALVIDRQTGRIFVMATWSHGERSWRGSGPGLAPEQTGQWMMVHSDDEGVTWSKPRNLTRQLKRPEWSFLLQGPGRGICMANGTLVVPAQFLLGPDKDRMPYATLVWSMDHGETWRVGRGAMDNTTESALVELNDGVLMSNQRNNRGGSRSVFTTPNLGVTWSEHGSSRSLLQEPVCMASLIHVGRELGGAADGLLLFSNPDVARGPRRRMSIKASTDSGNSWPGAQTLLLDEGVSAGYSCLTMIDAKTVGILYECSRAQLAFQRVALADVLAGGEAQK